MLFSLHPTVHMHDVCIHYLVHTPYVHSCVSLPHLGVCGFTVAHALVPVAHRKVCLKVAHPLSCCALGGGFFCITPVVTVGVCSPRYHQSQTWFTRAVSSDFRMRARLVDCSSVLTLAVQLLLCTLTRACVFRLLLPCMFHRGHA